MAYKYISSATTTQVLNGPGVLERIVIGETAAGAITIYDNTGSDTDTVLAVLKASIAEQTLEFGAKFKNGLKIITAGASKITVVVK